MLKRMQRYLALGQHFYFLWAGESFALLGTALMEFALGVWVYRETRSVASFAGVVLAATVPAILFLPLAGGLADRISRRHIIIATDITLALMLAMVMGLLYFDLLKPMHLYVFNCLASILTSFRKPAYQASVNSILPKDKFTLASGVMSISQNTSTLVAPLIAGWLMEASGLVTILAIDLILFGTGTLLVLKAFSHLTLKTQAAVQQCDSVTRDVWRNIREAATFFVSERLMLGLLLYVMLRNALVAVAMLMMTPLVLSIYSSQTLGLVYTWAAIGGLAGASLLIALGNPARLMRLIAGFDAVLSLCVISIGITVSPVAYCVLACLAIASANVANAASNALWMRKTPKAHRASVFSLTTMLTAATTALSIFVGGVVVDHILQPALSAGGIFEKSIGIWVGTGKGRGVALLFIISGFAGLALCGCTLGYRRMRRLDLLVPDDGDAAQGEGLREMPPVAAHPDAI